MKFLKKSKENDIKLKKESDQKLKFEKYLRGK